MTLDGLKSAREMGDSSGCSSSRMTPFPRICATRPRNSEMPFLRLRELCVGLGPDTQAVSGVLRRGKQY